jgi:3-deoxy-D-arabino-heptulosonate 7-phosphate (DAHP) synthase class II
MNKIVQIKIFNDILDQLFDYLESNFPFFRSDVVLTRSTIEFLRNSNPRLVVEQFMTHVSPYKAQIHECNEYFFLNFENNLSKSDLTSDNILVGMKLKNMWISSETSDVQKAHLWLFFQRLLKAGDNASR